MCVCDTNESYHAYKSGMSHLYVPMVEITQFKPKKYLVQIL